MNGSRREPPAAGWHGVPVEDALFRLGTDAARGLAEDEARRRLAEYGPNALPERRRRSWGAVFLRQFASPLIYLLFIAAGIAVAVGNASDGVVILVVVVANALVGGLQEGRAERSMAALRRMAALQVRVWREGGERLVPARELVPGDILLLAAGDAVGADGRLLEVAALRVSEAALTGESLPVAKDAAVVLAPEVVLADRRNLVHAGTHVAAGRGRALVTATGADTEVGRIASLTEGADEPKTPLEQRLAGFGRGVAVAAVALFGLVVAVGLGRGLPWGDVLMVAIGQMVSMVPEGLPVAMTIALAVGMQRMAARGAIVRRLSAVETLGAITVICTDKTGTLTRNEMTVTTVWLPGGRRWNVTGTGYAPDGGLVAAEEGMETAATPAAGEETSGPGSGTMRSLIEAVVLCNDARLVPPDPADPRWRALGDPTEASLLTLAAKAGVDAVALRRAWPRLGEHPFDPSTRRMVTWHGRAAAVEGGRGSSVEGPGRVVMKGAVEAILDLCTHWRRDDGPGGLVGLGVAERMEIERVGRAMADGALRVLAVAEAEDCGLGSARAGRELPASAIFLGLVGQMDPPRDEARLAVAECRRAGIRPVMVTGDHPGTGLAVARALGMAGPGDRAVDGRELEAMPEQDLRHDLGRIPVFARVHPAQKLRIIEAFQARGEVVAMTGDGVNDAPALARADVGLAMGITGTEVAKAAAKVVITDDNFATMVKAVELGRLVYQNLQKVLLFLLATSIDEVIVLLAALLMGYPLPLAAVQILWINLVTEGTLTVNLVMEQAEGGEMGRAPIGRTSGLFTRAMLGRMSLMVLASAGVTLGFFLWRLGSGAPFGLVQSETFTLLAVCQWFNVLNCRSATASALDLGLFRNGWLVGGLLVANLLQVAVIYAPPLNHVFHTVPIPAQDVLLIGLVASPVIWIEELRKWIVRRRRRASGAGPIPPELSTPGPSVAS